MSNSSKAGAWPQLRRAWIERYAKTHGSIRRRDICGALGISMAQASADLQRVLEDNPGCLDYCAVEKSYRWAGKSVRTRMPEFLAVLSAPGQGR